jgi:hypothetical protein
MISRDLSDLLQEEKNLAIKLEGYIGQWVAVRDHQVVSNAGTLRALLDQVNPEQIDRVLEVPEDSGSCYFF